MSAAESLRKFSGSSGCRLNGVSSAWASASGSTAAGAGGEGGGGGGDVTVGGGGVIVVGVALDDVDWMLPSNRVLVLVSVTASAGTPRSLNFSAAFRSFSTFFSAAILSFFAFASAIFASFLVFFCSAVNSFCAARSSARFFLRASCSASSRAILDVRFWVRML